MLCAHVNKHLSRQGKQLKNTISEEESRDVPHEVFFNMFSLPVFENNNSI